MARNTKSQTTWCIRADEEDMYELLELEKDLKRR